MNDNEAKALFFAQYFGHRVYNASKLTVNPTLITAMYNNPDKERFLLLRSVSDLTDVEADKIKILMNWVGETNNTKALTQLKIDGILGMKWDLYCYLRSIGVLTPFLYLSETKEPITLTPEQIIAKGWCKIKTI